MVTIRKNYFGWPKLKQILEYLCIIALCASLIGIFGTTRFNENLYILKLSNNPDGWYMLTFLELLGVIAYGAYRHRSLLLGFLVAYAVVGFHELIWLFGQGAAMIGYINVQELYWAEDVFFAPLAVVFIFKVNHKIYLIPMLCYLALGLIVPWFFSPAHNDVIGWTLCCFSVCLGLGSARNLKSSDSSDSQKNLKSQTPKIQ